eukprot:791354-Prymnesium_polylepis.1
MPALLVLDERGAFQKCFNNYLFTKGESILEQAACDYVSGGAGAAFCSSQLFKGITGVFNKVLNGYPGTSDESDVVR